jgi:mono/diheme cytochrome c family protein
MKWNLIAVAALLGTTLTFRANAAPDKWKNCAKCHGDDGKGKTKMGEKLKVGDMTTAEWQDKHKDADMKKVVRAGDPKVKMPASGTDKLSDAEIDELVKYIRTLKK